MSFFKDLMGKSSAKAATQLGQRNASQINAGYDSANTQAQTGYDASMGFLNPFAESGRRGQTAYENTLGLNGAPARQQQFQESYLDDPALAYRTQQTGTDINNLLRKYNAGPQGVNSGAAALGAGRIRAENFNRDWDGTQNRLMGLGQQGLQVAGQQAGLTTGFYDGQAGRSIGRSNALVGNDTQATMAASNARMSGVNNILKIAGGAAQLATGIPWSSLGTPQQASPGSGGGSGYDPSRWGYTRTT